jgi:Kef-type K+ transport system membrane component KefB
MNAAQALLQNIQQLSHHHPLFGFALLLLLGYIFGKISSKIGLPEITGFIISGLFIGKFVLGLLPHELEESLSVITEIALGLIALTIGGEFSLSKLRRMGLDVMLITVVQVVLTFSLVAGILSLIGMPLPFALMLGAISAATAPAATVAIVQSLRAHGKFVDYLYGVVALDDAATVILFGIIFAFTSTLIGGGGSENMILHAFSEVGLSLLLGAVLGFILHISVRKRPKNEILLITLGIVFLSIALSVINHLSPLLVNMMLGAVLINLSPNNHRIFKILEPLSPPIYAMFFVIAGTELDPGILGNFNVLLFGIAYILARAAGKYFGVFSAAKLSRLEPEITKYLGFCMLPQAGVAIGLVLLVQTSPLMEGLPLIQAEYVDTMVNIVLFSVFVNEMVGPPLSKYAIVKGVGLEE